MGNEVAIYQTLRWAVGRLEIRKITACDRQQFRVKALGVLIDLRTDQFKKPFVPAFKSPFDLFLGLLHGDSVTKKLAQGSDEGKCPLEVASQLRVRLFKGFKTHILCGSNNWLNALNRGGLGQI
jgi:hypothetical protein